MGVLNLLGFKKKQPCTYCYFELELSPREVRILESQNDHAPVRTLKKECHICHIGFMIPVKYSDKAENLFLYPHTQNAPPFRVGMNGGLKFSSKMPHPSGWGVGVYHEIKPKIKNLDPHTLINRILDHY